MVPALGNGGVPKWVIWGDTKNQYNREGCQKGGSYCKKGKFMIQIIIKRTNLLKNIKNIHIFEILKIYYYI